MNSLSDNIRRYGWIFLLGYFVKLYWKQDSTFENNGYDLLSFSSKGSYDHRYSWQKFNR